MYLSSTTADGSPTPSHAYRTYSPEDCPFETVIVDVTHRCNMACHNCYIPNRTVPDLDAGWLTKIIGRLPRGTFVRLIGAEPTMRDDLPQIIRAVRTQNQHPVLVTNGLRLADRAYVRELKQAGLQVVYLSMNGGFDDGLYAAIDNMCCAQRKARAFDNLRVEHMYTSIGMIIIRGVNERAVAPVLATVRATRNVRELHLRSVGAIGRFMKSPPLTLEELLEVFVAAAGVPDASFGRRQRTAASHDFRFERLRVQLTEWPDLGSATRGRLTPEGLVAPFFEHVVENEGGY